MKELRKDVLIEPRYLGPGLLAEVKSKLAAELEGQCLGTHGYVISLMDIHDSNIIPGKIENDSSAVHFTVKYQVILLRPFRNEVMDAVVTIAPEEIGFFAHVGPLQIFVSRHNIPLDIQFNPTTESWVSSDYTTEIKPGTVVRLRINGLQFTTAGINAIGTINETFLGAMF